MSLSPDQAVQAHAAGGILIVLAVAVVVVLYVMHLEHNRERRQRTQPQKTLAQHIQTHAVHHISAGLAVIVGVVLILGVGTAYVIYRSGGAIFNPHLHKAVNPVLAIRGRGGPAVSPDLEKYLPPVGQQGATSACGPFSLVETIYAQLRAQGGRPSVHSPWQNYYYAAGNSPAGTSIDEDVSAAAAHGVETLAGWPALGGPDSTDAAQTTRLPAIRYDTVFYQPQGWNGLYAVEAELDAGYVVILLHKTNDGEYNAFGQSVTDNTGSFRFNHFAVAYSHVGDTIYLRNSWGPTYGINGDIGFTPTAFLNTVLAAYVVHVEVPAAWLPPPPTPTTVPLRTATPRATVTATPRPVPCVARTLRLRVAANLHSRPVIGAPAVVGLPAGATVQTACPAGLSTHWIKVTARHVTGWLWRAAL